MHPTIKLAYILKGFPRTSETFIAQEIHRLEELGVALRLYSIKSGDQGIRHGLVDRIRAPTTYLPTVSSLTETSLWHWLRENWKHFSRNQHWLLRHRPLGYCKALGWAVARMWRYRAGRRLKKTFIKEFLFAGEIAQDLLAQPGPSRLHAHFCHDATNVTWMVSLMTGLPFSFTAHAKDIYQKKLNPGELLAEKIAAANFVVTCTKANLEHLRAVAIHHADARLQTNIHCVYHGLDLQHFHNDCCNKDNPPLILSVGRMVEKKGFIHLLEACAQLQEQGHKFQCCIIGERGDQSAILEDAIARLKLADRVTLRGPMTQEALIKIYARASLFALPSVVLDDGDRDGIPNVLAEAMSMGLPVVSTPISGIPELVDNSVNGLLVPPRDSLALAQTLGRLLADPSLRARLATQARQSVSERFDATLTHQRLLELFKSVGGGAKKNKRISVVPTQTPKRAAP